VTAPVVKSMDEGGYAVRGTEDVTEARVAVLRHLMWDGPYADDELDEAIRLALHLATTARRLWRWTPCHPSSCFDGGGHSGHLGYPDRPGPGVWRGVVFYS